MHLNRTFALAAAAAMLAGSAFAQDAAPASPADQAPADQAAPAAPDAAAPAEAAPPSAAAQAYMQIAPAGNLADTLKASGQFTKFLAAAEKSNLIALLTGDRPITIFVPTDVALGASWDALSVQELQPLMLYHLYGATIAPDQIDGKKGPVQTAANKPIEVDGSVDPMKINDSVVLQKNVMTTNGGIYVIDKPLTPPA